KTVKYKDKDVKAGETYSYKVVAFKENKATKKTVLMGIEDSASVKLGFADYLSVQKQIEKSDGSIELQWNRVIGAEGYIVEKQNKTTDQYDQVTVLPANQTTYTFSASAADKDPMYRICAYAGSSYTEYQYVSPAYRTARTSGIAASPTVLADGTTGISVSWQPVAGAAYYKVYRSRQYTGMNADSGNFKLPGTNAVVTVYKDGKLSDDGTYYVDAPEYTDKITGTSVVDTYQGYPYMSYENDQQLIKTRDVADSPQEGIRYYYYVQAFAADGEPVVNEYESYTSTRTIYEGGWVGAPASAMINNVTATKPVIKKVKAEGKGKVEVAWKKSAKADKYIVYYSTKKKSGYTYGGITSKNKITIKGLTPGKTYYFQVKGIKANAAGGDVYSSLSKAKSVKVR
ncbi:MAG TPA: fibronectin type III domain-containing protein, partial [Candidatus Choladousia intestinipullorum]|nr:fibronectin type III domain-containing protein [Candidatus Choladousia intestinipullorum]